MSVSEVKSSNHKSGNIWKPVLRRNTTRLEEPVFMSGVLVSRDQEAHSAHKLCSSDSSMGPDFVSTKEQFFCDITAKEVWPLCSAEIPHECFDLVKQEMVAVPNNGKRNFHREDSAESA